MKEGNISRLIMIAASKATHRLWLNTRGSGWVGQVAAKSGDTVTLRNARPVTYGVGPNGASDLIGFARIKVTPDMVGRELAIFVAVEVKVPGEKPRPDQEAFIRLVQAAGGLAGSATSESEAMALLSLPSDLV